MTQRFVAGRIYAINYKSTYYGSLSCVLLCYLSYFYLESQVEYVPVLTEVETWIERYWERWVEEERGGNLISRANMKESQLAMSMTLPLAKIVICQRVKR